mmetsp:Transcript_78581/g.189820  ORF Transcript_78581/g.189820 Transcript_78581/m.189820 type:complete len:256 (-) Transcript_78581:414-1181(-)
MLRWPRLVTVTWLASEQISRAVSQSVFTPCTKSNGNDLPQQWYVVQCSLRHELLGPLYRPDLWPKVGARRGSLLHMRKESVAPRRVTRDDLHGEESRVLNSSAPRRSTRATSYVPAYGTVISTGKAVPPSQLEYTEKSLDSCLKKTSPVGSTPTVGSSTGTKGARAISSKCHRCVGSPFAGAANAHEWQPSQHCAAMVLVSRCLQGCILHPVWHAPPRSGTPCAQVGAAASMSTQSWHIEYECPLTSREQPRDVC